MTEPASLTRSEAEARAALIGVRRYDIAVDMTGLLEGPTIEAVSTVSFTCEEPGASTFVDCVAEIRHATLNGRTLDLSTVERGRLPLPDLAADNVLVVASAQADTGSSAGILRTVDPSDKLVYVWTSFEPDAARRVWACFDQPDLKAPHAFTVTAPESWTVTSNCPPDSVETAPDEVGSAARVWRFGDTPPLSTYVVVVNAGPFVELRSSRGGYDLGLYARQSLAKYLERDAEELFTVTAQGLAFFGERFALPFPQQRYDQVFVPNMGGAMENWGCVTWTDAVIYRSSPSYAQRALRASILLHEMAHMWFGDLVTMQWWDDLWLNEAFASWAASWSSAAATEHVDAWAGFLVGIKAEGYRADMSPGTHPIRADVPGRRPGDGELRRDHLRQGRERAQAARGVRRRGRVRRGPARLLPRPRLGQHPPRRPDGRGGHRRGPGPDRLDQRLAGPVRHRHHPARHRRADHRVARLAAAATAPPGDPQLHGDRRRPGRGGHCCPSRPAAPAPRSTSRRPTCTCSTPMT